MIKQAWHLALIGLPWLRETYDYFQAVCTEAGVPWEPPMAVIREEGGLTVKFNNGSLWRFCITVEKR